MTYVCIHVLLGWCYCFSRATCCHGGVAEITCSRNSGHVCIVQGWIEGVSNEKNWVMMCSVGVHSSQANTAWCGDNRGKIRCLDLRSKEVQFTTTIHGYDKITSLEFHPHDSNLMLSAGNDHCVKLFDVRMLKPSGAGSKARFVHEQQILHLRIL
jgi:WD40 repeat protein